MLSSGLDFPKTHLNAMQSCSQLSKLWCQSFPGIVYSAGNICSRLYRYHNTGGSLTPIIAEFIWCQTTSCWFCFISEPTCYTVGLLSRPGPIIQTSALCRIVQYVALIAGETQSIPLQVMCPILPPVPGCGKPATRHNWRDNNTFNNQYLNRYVVLTCDNQMFLKAMNMKINNFPSLSFQMALYDCGVWVNS